MNNRDSNIFSEREKTALMENLRSDFSVPLDVIVGYAEIIIEELLTGKNDNTVILVKREKFSEDVKKILNEGITLHNKVEDSFEFATFKSKQKDFDLSDFIRMLHHKLLTPLNSIIGYVELLWEDEFAVCGPQMNKDLLQIYDAAKLFIGYINKISMIAKTELEGGEVIEQFKSLSKVIRNLVSSIPQLSEKIEIQQSKEGMILIVDDNQMELELLKRRVEHYGYTAVTCDNGSEVLNILNREKIDLVLLQIMLSGVNGFEVLKQIKRHKSYLHLPVIVISPLKELDAVVRCYEIGADDYLTKPFHPVIFKARLNNWIEKKKLIDREQLYLDNLEIEKVKSENLLLSILPLAIATRLKTGEEFITERVELVTILFVDIVGFSYLSEKLNPHSLISLLNQVFSGIDKLLDKYHVEKIKTIGDSYMAVAGVPIVNEKHAESIANVALEILELMREINRLEGYDLHVRIGIHSGSVIAGIIGTKKFNYDLWGKAVNLASRMESQGIPDKIQVSESTYKLLQKDYLFEKRGVMDIRNIGPVTTYFLLGHK